MHLSDVEIATFLQYVKAKFSNVLIPAQSIKKYNSLGEGNVCLGLPCTVSIIYN